ncbi:reverse transcriptase [Phytophthora megakarya]|uniref:Reverse transcriptase n=1 Tax=Phytophthora megakarya TaxID=4795 RepID=A0A225V977_9STRA|nr:reverse transcriptase [Phytophthora megakarya]
MIYESSSDENKVMKSRATADACRGTTLAKSQQYRPAIIQEERLRRISKAQEEELRCSMLKAILRRETTKMSYKEARDAWKWSDKFVLSSDNILYYVGPTRRKSEDDQPELSLRLVVPTTMIQEVLQNCHVSIEGGHQGVVRSYQRVKHDYY